MRFFVKIRQFFIRIFMRMGFLPRSDVHYVGGSETLPPPLTTEEESYFLSRFYSDNKNVRRVLIERNLRLVVYIARKFENTGIGTEDLTSIGTIGLIKAINTFCPEKNIKLATYASRCIENEILMYLRKTSSRRGELSIDEPLNTDCDGNELLLSDILTSDGGDELQFLDDETDRKLLRSALEKLGERERSIISMRFGLGSGGEHTQKEVADMLGISQSYISRLEKRIILRLRREMQKLM